MSNVVIFARDDLIDRPALITPWAAMHFATGVMAHAVWRVLFPSVEFYTALVVWFIMHVIYEGKDFYYTYVSPQEGFERTWQNSIADQAFAVAGLLLAMRFGVANRPVFTAIIALVSAVILIASPISGTDGKWETGRGFWFQRG